MVTVQFSEILVPLVGAFDDLMRYSGSVLKVLFTKLSDLLADVPVLNTNVVLNLLNRLFPDLSIFAILCGGGFAVFAIATVVKWLVDILF